VEEQILDCCSRDQHQHHHGQHPDGSCRRSSIENEIGSATAPCSRTAWCDESIVGAPE
jgi:hypothetical protein